MDFTDFDYFENNISSINLDLCWQEDDRVADAEWRWGHWETLDEFFLSLKRPTVGLSTQMVYVITLPTL